MNTATPMLTPVYTPMLVSAGRDFPLDAVFEPKWDGWRALVEVVDGRLSVRTRSGREVSATLPELDHLPTVLASAVGGARVVLDGELIVHDGTAGSFSQLAGRMARVRPRPGLTDPGPPVSFVAFDVLHLGESLISRPWHERRHALEALALTGPAWCTTALSHDAPALWQFVLERDLEGIVAKNVHSLYRPGVRSTSWVKFKTAQWRRLHAPSRRPRARR